MLARMVGVAGRQDDPAADVGFASGERSEGGADEVDERGGLLGCGQFFGFQRQRAWRRRLHDVVQREGGLAAGAGGPVG